MSNMLSKKKTFHLWFSKLRCFPTGKPSSSPPQSTAVANLENSDFSSTSTTEDCIFSSFSDDSTSDSDTVPDFSAVFASHRFFVSSPGSSNSIFESPDRRPGSDGSSIAEGVQVRKVSLDPYVDFRRSMQEMIEARDRLVDIRRDWQYLQELLLCYLQINPIDTHRFILRAFSDLVVYLLETSSESSSNHHLRRSNIDSHCEGLKVKQKRRELRGYTHCPLPTVAAVSI